MENYLVELNMVSLGDEACCLKKCGMNISQKGRRTGGLSTHWRREATKPPCWTMEALRRSNSDEYGKMRQKQTVNVCHEHLSKYLKQTAFPKDEGCGFGEVSSSQSKWAQGIGGWLFLGSHNFCEAHSRRSVTVGLQSNIASVLRG